MKQMLIDKETHEELEYRKHAMKKYGVKVNSFSAVISKLLEETEHKYPLDRLGRIIKKDMLFTEAEDELESKKYC